VASPFYSATFLPTISFSGFNIAVLFALEISKVASGSGTPAVPKTAAVKRPGKQVAPHKRKGVRLYPTPFTTLTKRQLLISPAFSPTASKNDRGSEGRPVLRSRRPGP
jgi:hypothetical protein